MSQVTACMEPIFILHSHKSSHHSKAFLGMHSFSNTTLSSSYPKMIQIKAMASFDLSEKSTITEGCGLVGIGGPSFRFWARRLLLSIGFKA